MKYPLNVCILNKNSYVIKLSLKNRFHIGTVICPRDSRISPRPRANTTALGQITVPLSNLLFNNI